MRMLAFLLGLIFAVIAVVYWVVPAGNSLRLSQRESVGALRVAGIERLRLLDDLAPLADGLTIFAESRGDASEWRLRFGALSFCLTLSAEVWRGFSGEGQVLAALAATERDRLLGKVMLTLSPTATSVCCEASSATWTWRVVDVACITGWPGCALPPSWADTLVTRTAVGSNTAWPRVSVPVWLNPTAAWSFSTAVVVADPKEAEVRLS